MTDQGCLAGDDLDDRAPPVGRVRAPLDQACAVKLFDIASHPDITYTVDGMQPASGGARVTGSLTVRGRTRPLSFDAEVSAVAGEVQLDAEVPVNRADFGLAYSPLRMASLNNTIVVHAVFTR